MKNTRKYFGTDGIRGYANKSPMTAVTAMKVGMALAWHSNAAITVTVWWWAKTPASPAT